VAGPALLLSQEYADTMTFREIAVAATLALAAGGSLLFVGSDAAGQTARDPTAEGKAVYKRANCMGCHKWHGNGGGGYGGDALSLRRTVLTRAEIIETVSCGRPATGMPYHLRDAYEANVCYGITRKELGETMPQEAAGFLRTPEIEAVADYVILHIKGKGEPDYADCLDFFGDGSRVCNIYKQAPPAAAGAPAN
jgi:mono/diheme cytochrome c family protein